MNRFPSSIASIRRRTPIRRLSRSLSPVSDLRPVNLSASGPPETVLPPEPDAVLAALDAAAGLDGQERSAALRMIAAERPRWCGAWAALGDDASEPIEAYAYYRVGYHRGLDALRANGWRGSGYVRWRYESNRGFLAALAGLARQAAVIGEVDEAERCEMFLRQCDPSWPPSDPSQD